MLTRATRKLFANTLLQQAAIRSFSASPAAVGRWSDLVQRTKDSVGVIEVTAPELSNELKGATTPILIDIRESSEWHRTGKLPGAICVSRGVLELKIEDIVLPDAKKEVVLYCAGGLRSVMAAESLIRMGYKKDLIKSLHGGFDAWQEEGFNIEKVD